MATRQRNTNNTGDDLFLGSLALAAIGALVVVAWISWLTGQCAALLATGHWPARPGSGQAFRVLGHLVTRRGDISAYWPQAPMWLYYTLLVLLLAAAGALAFYAARWWINRTRGAGATWGGRAVELKLAAPEDPAARVNRIPVGHGTATRRLIATTRNLSATAIGITGSGKTAGLIVPNVVEWAGPAVMSTVKASDLDPIQAAKPRDFFVIAPAGLPAGRVGHRWSPVDYCVDAKAADRMATWFAESASAFDDPRAAIWIDQAVPIIKGMLLAAHLHDGGINLFRRWLQEGASAADEVYSILRAHGENDVAADYYNPWKRLHADGVGSIQLTLNVIAKVYADEEVRAAASGTDVTAETLLDTGGTLCLVSPEGDADRYAPLMSVIIASVIYEAERRFQQSGTPLSPGLGLFIDEAGNFLRYKKLPSLLTTGRGAGILLLTIWHDISQLRSRFGENDAGTIINNSPMRVLLPGNADLPTLQLFAQLLGKEEVSRISVSRGGGYTVAQRQTNIQETDLAPVNALQQLEDGTALVLYGNLRPIKVRMRMWYEDKRILQRVPTWRDRDGIVHVILPQDAGSDGGDEQTRERGAAA